MIRIQFNIAAISASLDKAANLLGDLTPINKDIGDYMIEATKERFRTSTAPNGTKWRDKRPATIARYLARGDGDKSKPLIGPSGRLGKEIAKVVSRTEVEIGSALEYAGVMQGGARKGVFGKSPTGLSLPFGNIPSRVWLGLSDTDEINIVDIVDEHSAAALGGGEQV